jgi:hypothetical protein
MIASSSATSPILVLTASSPPTCRSVDSRASITFSVPRESAPKVNYTPAEAHPSAGTQRQNRYTPSRRSRPLTLPGEIDGQHGTPRVEPLPLLGPRLDIGAKRGDYAQVGDGVQRAPVRSPHQGRSWTYQIDLHPLAYPLLWNHRFPFLLRRQLNRSTFYATSVARDAVEVREFVTRSRSM